MNSIQKIKLNNGTYYLDIPKANVKILCASPPEVFKMMAQKGITKWLQEGNWKYETGPSVILISDILIQRETFCNFIEFPILQMFYRQGMIIPTHPNNDGSKPVLVGTQDQVYNQVEYFYTGNYGLISLEEIQAAVRDDDLANDIYQMKLKFAFGKFQKREDLIDICIVENEYKEIKNKVFVKRFGLNQFKIYHDNDYVEVDLNLYNQEKYDSLYKLKDTYISRSYFSVVHTGEGDGWNIDLPSMSSIITFKGKIYVIDAPPYIETMLFHLGIGINEVEGIFHTHAHDDHFAGILSFMKAEKKIKYIASPLIKKTTIKKLSAFFYDNPFDYFFNCVDLEIEQWNSVEDGLEVKPFISAHPIETTCMFFRAKETPQTYKTYGHFADTSPFDFLENLRKDGKVRDEFIDTMLKNYVEPVDLKKIDVGGGLIHGNLNDFLKDGSKQVVFSHLSNAAALDEYRSNVSSFGQQDVLIEEANNYLLEHALEQVSYFFSCSSKEFIQIWEENESTPIQEAIKLVPPNETIYDEGDEIEKIYFVLSGEVRITFSYERKNAYRGYGNFIAMYEYFNEINANGTYSTNNYVNLFCFSQKMIEKLCTLRYDIEVYKDLINKKSFLKRVSIFNRYLSSKKMLDLAQEFDTMQFRKGIRIDENILSNYFLIVAQGEIDVVFCNHLIRKVKGGDFICAKSLFLYSDLFAEYTVKEDTVVYVLPLDTIKSIPVSCLKIFEMELRNKESILNIIAQKKAFLVLEGYVGNKTVLTHKHHQFVYLINIAFYAVTYVNNSNLFYKAISGIYGILNKHLSHQDHSFISDMAYLIETYQQGHEFDKKLIDRMFNTLREYIKNTLGNIDQEGLYLI